jgi:hypothetical protein
MPGGVYTRTEEHKRKISEALKGKPFTDERRKHISDALKGRHLSEETRKKLSECHIGEKNLNWKGGFNISGGYVRVLYPEHPKAYCGIGYVKRCELIWEAVYGAVPDGWEVHHVNGNKTDDRIENLCALENHYHSSIEMKRHFNPIDFVVVAGIYPKREDTWKYIDSIKLE